MGDRRKRALRVRFDNKLRRESHRAKITSDAGTLLFRELDEASRLREAASIMFSDSRRGKNAVKRTRLSCRDFEENRVRPQSFALAYNLGNFLRRPALPRSVQHRSLTTLREKLIQIGAKVVAHSRYVIFQTAEVAAPRELFTVVLEGIQRFGVPLPLVQPG
jgi:hypothetical protein